MFCLLQELVSEKLKTQQRDNELERLAHELEMKILNQEGPEQQLEQESPENRCKHSLTLGADVPQLLPKLLERCYKTQASSLQQVQDAGVGAGGISEEVSPD